MDKKIRFKTILWEILFPLFMYYMLFLCMIYLVFMLIGYSSYNYMIAQCIAAGITIPAVYFWAYRPTQKAFVEKTRLSKQTLVNIVYIAIITLVFSSAINNLVSMSPLVELSAGYEKANTDFFANTIVVELIGSAILSPIMEELVFRGVIFANLKKVTSVNKAIFISSLLFGLVHFNVVQFLYAFILGIVLAMFMEKSGHVYAAIIGHIVANALAVIRTETGFMKELVDRSLFAWSGSVVLMIMGIFMLTYYLKKVKIW